MSGRLLKKVLKEHEESKLQNHHDEEEEEDDEDEEQLGGSRNRSSINPFDLLNDGDEDPESEKEAEIDDEEKKKDEEADTVQPPSSKNKSKKKKNKKKPKESRSNVVVKSETTFDETLEALSLGTNSIQEEVQETKPSSSSSSSSRPVLEIDPKYLNLENELRRMYGSKVVRSLESSTQAGAGGGPSRQVRGGRRGGVHHITKTVLITPMENWARWDRSFSMEFLETKDGYNYFRYTHSSSYEQAQRAFQAAQNLHDLNGVASVLINNPYHIDSLITMADYFKFAGDHQMSADAIGKCLYGLERAWHPMFTPFNGNCRLKFAHDTNKPFFTTLFAHMRNMDRRGCHRSALEEYAWLEEFSEEYHSENSLWLFPNFSYSLAIARVYLEKTESTSSDTSKSSSLDLMMQALKLHPTVLKKLVDKSKNPSLDHLISIYVERNYLIWRLPDVQKLLKSAAELVIKQLDEKESDAEDFLSVKEEAFPAKHNEYSHLSIHDFSDTVPTLPPDNLQNFVAADPRMGGDQVAAGGGGQQAPPPVRDVANRNPLAVFLESMLPWVNLGEGDDDGDHQPDNNG
ncbi:hypothetical protein Bca52824_050102 [Brassica carinata]|uniref:Transcription factor 25 n=1 Tax=Brassica carinata TaxID=52824 RepID=A0A8X7RJU5_BRACI|nr:hypothetical protein Bca52824_050102 [Brassica carinata]